ncbi:uncharacterized protein LOC132726365 [Ruditapes philippinarum]|uniref:uncharacterized protein LOC132726365 n=1 Tax=Ruditapes philippinarum TaxID=129788 RepID=UPI00295A8952|nr:uncharacterized protein LOC132726365 [Ruditapes philippinarum]
MEVYGRKLTDMGSDEAFEYPCTLCAKDKKNVAASKYCVECDENLCKTCLDHHSRFPVTKGHQIVEVQSLTGKRLELPSQRCEKHGGKVIDEYCQGHDKVGCSTCMNVDHSRCEGINFIPSLVKKFETSHELQRLENAIESIHTSSQGLKSRKQNDLKRIQQERSQLLQEIKSERQKINDKLDKMEEALLQKVRNTFDVKEKNVVSTIHEIDGTITSLDENLQRVKAARCENDSEKYVQLKMGLERKKLDESNLKLLDKTKTEETMRLEPANQITEQNIIGRVIKHKAVESVKLHGTFDIHLDDDKEICCIHDMCICSDGTMIMLDYNNKRIKKVDTSYKVIYVLNVADTPACVCQVNESLLAVTLINEKKVQFVTQKSPMKLETSFSVGDRCRGIAFKDRLLYVSCGGSKNKSYKEGVGHLEVYSISGSIVTSFYGKIEYPLFISAPSWSPELFIGDHRRGIVSLDSNRNLKDIVLYQAPDFQEPQGICWLDKDTLCVAFYVSHTVVQMSRDGLFKKTLLTEKDGIKKPYSLCFDEKTSRLVVSFNKSNTIKVFTLDFGTK